MRTTRKSKDFSEYSVCQTGGYWSNAILQYFEKVYKYDSIGNLYIYFSTLLCRFQYDIYCNVTREHWS